ncbi:MAG TPA: ATP-binding protein [Thermoanaerobaculia bacterium]|nr:ATP-binding protein [Thermoanaerobaculia bacterium]
MITATLRRKLVLSLASALTALVFVTGGVGIQRKIETFQSGGLSLSGGDNRVVVAFVDPAVHRDLRRGDRLLLVGGDTVRRVTHALEHLRAQAETEVVAQRGGDVVTLRYVRPPLEIDWSYLVQALIGGLYLLIGLYTVVREQSRQSLLFYLWCAASSAFFLLVATPADQLLTDDTGKALYVVEELARILLPPLTLHFFLRFPAELQPRTWSRRLIPLLYLPAAFLATLQWDLIANDGRLVLGSPGAAEMSAIVSRLDRAELFLFAAFAVAAGLLLLYRLLIGERREAHRQLLWIALGMAGGYVPFVALYLIPWSLGLSGPQSVEVAAVLPLAVVPLTFAYAILRWRLWDIAVIARDVATYGLTFLFGLAGFWFLRMLVDLGVPASEGFVRNLLSVAAVLVMGGLLVPARQGIGTALERVQYRAQFGKRRNLAQLGRELLHERDLERLSTRLLLHVEEALALDRSNLLLNEEEHLVPLRRVDGSLEQLPLDLFGGEFWQEDHRELQGAVLPVGSDSARELHLQGYRYAFPLTLRGRKVGVLVCGLRYGEMPFSSDDLELVRQLLDQAALAIENAHLLDRLQHQLEEVRQLKQYAEDILEACPAGIAVLDGEGRILTVNLAFAALAGIDPDALRRKSLLDVLPLERVPLPQDGLIELGIVDGRGRERSLQASVAPFSSTRGGALAVLVVNDISERVAMERALEEKERLASLGIMAAGIAHEVNTPITGISSYAQMLLAATDATDPRYELLKKVERQTFRASRIVNSLLSLARNQAIDAQPVDVGELVDECLELLHDRTEAQGIEVEVQKGAEPAIATGADGELQQVFTNLFQNAIEAQDGGGLLRVGVSVANPWIEISVDDGGPGISPALRERVFEPFYSTKQRSGGSGLGLSISHEIIRRHGGELQLEERPDGPGCRLLVRLRAVSRRSA